METVVFISWNLEDYNCNLFRHSLIFHTEVQLEYFTDVLSFSDNKM